MLAKLSIHDAIIMFFDLVSSCNKTTFVKNYPWVVVAMAAVIVAVQ